MKDMVNGRLRKAVVVDVGGGKHCPYAHVLKGGENTTIIAMDISESDLRYNSDVQNKLVADIAQGLPIGRQTVDIITSRTVLEHIDDVGGFVVHTRDVLKPGGYCIHFFPSKFAPFALLNQMLPKAVSKALVEFFWPEQKGICAFPSFYNECYDSAIRNLLLKNGFELVDVKLSFYQSQYFDFCFPLFAISAVYDELVELLGVRNLAAYVLVVARKT